MRQANLASNGFSVDVIPTKFRWTMVKDFYDGSEGEKLVDIKYEILCGKYKKLETVSVEGVESERAVEVDFVTPVHYDEGITTIPAELYLLIEQYRLDADPIKLFAINQALAQFNFVGSLSDFHLSVESID
ncbi:hypothetical protein GOQ04_17135 [Emticicia sp. ODNR4P]|nr:hypothetical protein [Emticicia sp. ODNR4P]